MKSPSISRIGIDIRKISDYGIGTVIQNLLINLAEFTCSATAIETNFHFYLFCYPENISLVPNCSRFKIIKIKAPGYSVSEHFELPFLAAGNHLDLLHIPHYVIPFLYPGKIIVNIWDLIHLLYPEYLPKPLLGFSYAKIMLKWAVKRSCKIIVPSESTAKDLGIYLKARSDKIKIIKPGISPDFLKPYVVHNRQLKQSVAGGYAIKTNPNMVAFENQIKSYQPYFLHTGSIRLHKNVPTLLRAFAKFIQSLRGAEDRQKYHLIFTGETDRFQSVLKNLTQQLGISSQVHFLGFLEVWKIPILYHHAKALVYPSFYEGFGLPILEAMACGIPVVTSDNSFSREIASEAALLIDPDKVEDLAQVMLKIVEDEDLRADLIKKGFKNIKRYSYQKMTEAVLKTYSECLNS